MTQLSYLYTAAAFVVAGILAFATTPLAKKFAFLVGAVDEPRGRHAHEKPTALMGGIAIFFGFVVSLLVFGSMDRQMTSILLGTLVIIVISAFDDIYDLPAWLRLVVQILAACIPVFYGGIRIDVLSTFGIGANPDIVLSEVVSIPVTIVWIVGITNAVNWIDGLDGLAAGVSGISAASLLVISCILGNAYVAVIMAALAGAILGFLPYNLNPAKIFMGDTGAMFLGFVLATMSIQGLFKFYVVVSFLVPFLVIGIPLLDMLIAIVRRVAHGQSPMASDREHMHYKLIDMGFNQKQTVAILYCISGMFGIAAIILAAGGEFKAILLLLAILVAAAFGVRLIASRERKQETPGKPPEDGGAEPDGKGKTDGNIKRIQSHENI